MENKITAASLTEELAARFRVLVLGGLAVISHGLDRMTYDGDVWLDSNFSPSVWADAVYSILNQHPVLSIVRMGSWQPVLPAELPDVIASDGVIRVMGASQPFDIFRKPNELEVTDFERVWAHAILQEDGTRLPDAIDLLCTKQDTGREKDRYDISFLEGKIEAQYARELPLADAAQALAMLGRYLTPNVAEIATRHRDPAVQEAGKQFLIELAADGDPFAADLLRKLRMS